MKKTLLLVFLLVICLVGVAQQRPIGFPSPNSNGYGKIGYQQADSGLIQQPRDTFPAKYPTLIRWSGDNTFWQTMGNGARWFPLSASTSIFANVKDYGAVGNGTTDDRAAFVSALASGKPVAVPYGKYYISSTITLSSSKSIIGFGDSSIIYVNGDYPAITIGGDNTTISDVRIMGNGRGTIVDYSTIRPSQDGIYIYTYSGGKQGNIIKNIRFDSLGGKAINYDYNYRSGREYGLSVSNVYAFKCFIGFKAGETAEYATWSNIAADSCQYGLWIQGGNNTFTGGDVSSNRTNLYLKKGTNDGHASITGFMINHALDKAVWSDSLQGGYTIGNSMIYYGSIYVTNSVGIKFSNCDLRPSSVTFINSTYSTFNNIYWVNNPTFSFTGASPLFFGNVWASGTSSSSIYNSIADSLQVTGGAWMKKQVNMGSNFHLSSDHSLYVSTEGSYNPPRFERHVTPNGGVSASAYYVYAAESNPITTNSGQSLVFQAVNASRTQFFNMGTFQWLYKQFDSTRPYTRMRLTFQDSSDYRNSLDLADNTPYFDFYPKWRGSYSYAFMGGWYANARWKPLALGTVDSAVVFIDTTYRVGINKTSPSYALDVVGDVNVTGNYKINGVNIASGTVTSIATNNASGITGGTITSSGTLAIDTSIIATRLRVQKGIDSLGAIVATKGSGTVTSIATDATMQGGTITSSGTLKVDTVIMATRPRVQKGIDSLASSLSSTYVPYTGATSDVNLAARSLSFTTGNITGSGYISLTSSPYTNLIQNYFNQLSNSSDGTYTAQSTFQFRFGRTNSPAYYTDLMVRNWTSANNSIYFQNKSYTVADSADVAGKLSLTGGTLTGSLTVTSDNVWLKNKASSSSAAQYQTWENSAGTRRGYMGYASGGDNTWSIVNEATNGGIVITPNGTGTTTISSLGTGTVQATAGVLSVTSDSRLKNKLGHFSNATDAIVKLSKPQYWKYSDKSNLPKAAQKVKQFGLLADEVHKVLGEEFAPTQKDGYYGLSDRALLSLAIQAIQELKAEIELLKKKKNK